MTARNIDQTVSNNDVSLDDRVVIFSIAVDELI